MNDKNNTSSNLLVESYQLSGARQMLNRLRDHYVIGNGLKGHDEKVYVKAELDMIQSSMDNVRHFLCGDCRIHYKNHRRDGKGRLISVEAYYAY